MMKTMRYLWMLLLSAGILCQAQSIFTGKLLDQDGNPMPRAHVHYFPTLNSQKPATSILVRQDGGFEIVLDKPGLKALAFSGVDHKMHIEFINLGAARNEHLEVRLEPNHLRPVFENVYILGTWNDFDPRRADIMEKQEDGSYRFEVPLKGNESEILYQVGGVVQDRSVNGTLSEGFKYDQTGDYYSIIYPQDGKATIYWDPAIAMNGPRSAKAIVTYQEPESYIAKAATALREHFAASSKFNEALQIYVGTRKGSPTEFIDNYDWSDRIEAVSKAYASHQEPELGETLTVIYINYFNKIMKEKGIFDLKLLAKMLEKTPPNSPVWELTPGTLAKIYDESPAVPAYMDQILTNHPSQILRSNLLRTLIWQSDREGNTQNLRKYFTWMKRDFGDNQETMAFLNQFDPDRPIMVGKQLPDFSSPQLGSQGEIISRDGMKGKIYLMDFWATWCRPCVQEMPNLHQAYEQFKDKGFEILSLSFDANSADITRFREQWAMPWRHTFIEGGFRSRIAQAFNVQGIPKPILVNKEGIIIAEGASLRGKALFQTVEKALTP